MCTVTYVPYKSGFIFTSNRDEHIDRKPSTLPEHYNHNNNTLFFPKDGEAGGTWVAIDKNNRLACLLNGAFVNHKRIPPYRKSRGIVVLEYFQYNSVYDFAEQYNFENIEPFTLIIAENNLLFELRWDSENTHIEQKNTNNAHIWSSSTLYSEEIAKERAQLFENITPEPNHVIEFHSSNFHLGSENGFLLNRKNGLKTVSQTQIIVDGTETKYYHRNFSTKKEFKETLSNTKPAIV